MSSNAINMLFRAIFGVLAAILITVITFPGPASATHRQFMEAENWTGYEFYGDHGTFFAKVTEITQEEKKYGALRADAIAVNNDGIWFRRSNGSSFKNVNERLTKENEGPFYGTKGTFFADVTGDGKADPIAVYDEKIMVRRSDNGLRDDERRVTSTDKMNPRYYGDDGRTFFADVDGDGKADAIAINTIVANGVKTWKLTVRRSNGKGSFGPGEDWTPRPCDTCRSTFSPGTWGTFFADVTGDRAFYSDAAGRWLGNAELIVVNDDGVKVSRPSVSSLPNKNRYLEGDLWLGTVDPPHDAFHGTLANRSQATFFADVNGDGKADAIGVNDGTRIVGDDGIGVRESAVNRFYSPDPNNGYKIVVGNDQPIRPWGYWTKPDTGDGLGFCRRLPSLDAPCLESFYGTRGTFFADVDGDGTADAIAVNDNGVFVRRSCKNLAPHPSCPGTIWDR